MTMTLRPGARSDRLLADAIRIADEQRRFLSGPSHPLEATPGHAIALASREPVARLAEAPSVTLLAPSD